MNEKLQTILAELRPALRKHFGERLEKILLYGSQARGDATWESDIDVMVVLREGSIPEQDKQAGSELAYDLSFRYDTLVSLLFVTQERFRTEQSPLLINVRREGLTL